MLAKVLKLIHIALNWFTHIARFMQFSSWPAIYYITLLEQEETYVPPKGLVLRLPVFETGSEDTDGRKRAELRKL